MSAGGFSKARLTRMNQERIRILMTQCTMDCPEVPGVFADFWTSAYTAIDD